MWLDEKNYAERTRGIYAAISGFPLNFLVPNCLRKLAVDYMDSVYPVKFRSQYFDVQLIKKAEGVLQLLSEELKDSNYFSNSSAPNEVDALVFGYLAIMLKLQLPTANNLQKYVEKQRNLVAYVNRILSEYFPEQEQVNKEQAIKDKAKDSNDLEKATWKSIILVGLVAVTSNLLYALYVLAQDEENDDESE